MARRIRRTVKKKASPETTNNLAVLKTEKELLSIKEGLLLEKAFKSDSPIEILSARNYLKGLKDQKGGTQHKSYLFDPVNFNQSLGYKDKAISVSYGMLRSMAKTPVIKAIVQTRQEQVANFSRATVDQQRAGWTIRKKKNILFPDQGGELTDREKHEIQGLMEFLENGGIEKREWLRDSFEQFLRKIVPDSLILDQYTFEVVQTRNLKPFEFFATDGATYRLSRSHQNQYVEEHQVPIKGYYPSYVQLYQGLVTSEFYPWELCFGVRNPSTNILTNGYGSSELEDMVRIITWMLYADEYNGRFFSQGASSKGFLFSKGSIDSDRLEEFRQIWRSQVKGIEGAWRIPLLEGAEDMQWIDLMKSNKDMEFQNWQNYLILLGCALYKTDPREIGFYNLGSQEGSVNYEGNSEYKLEFSKYKGLYPLLRSFERRINKHLIQRFYDGKYEFAWTGIEEDLEDASLDTDIKKLEAGIYSWEEIRKKYNLPPKLEPNDFLLNAVWLQIQQMKMGNQMSTDMVDGQFGNNVFEGKQNIFDLNQLQAKTGGKFDKNVFQQIQEQIANKKEKSNPFMKSLNEYMDEMIYKSK